MSLLIDTQLLIWAAIRPTRLSPEARRAIAENEDGRWFSLATIWEVAVKTSLGRPDFDVDPAQLRGGLLASGYAELPIDVRHCQAVAFLPWHHRDPFDRMLVAQAQEDRLTLLTADAALAAYGSSIRVV